MIKFNHTAHKELWDWLAQREKRLAGLGAQRREVPISVL